MRVTDKHVFFYSWKDDFSNHFKSKVPFYLPKHEREGIEFYTGEHMMMYEKAILFGDVWTSKAILAVHRPQEAKMLGRGVKGFKEEVWIENREKIMQDVCYSRILYDRELRNSAIDHRLAGRNFVEASPRDRIWGVGLEENHPMIDEEENWLGLNLLGKAWDRATDLFINRFIAGNRK